MRRTAQSTLALLTLAAAAQASDVVFHEDAALFPPGLAQSDSFASAVDLDGDTLAVGAPGFGPGWTGAVFVYRDVGGVWTQEAMLIGSATVLGDGFGDALDLEGDRLVVGASYAGSGAASSGEAYVFERAAGVWSQTAHLLPPAPTAQARFGAALALEGDRLAVGEPGWVTATGSVHVLELTGGVWSEVQLLLPSQPDAGQRFGSTLDLDAGTLVSGAPLADQERGLVYVYTDAGAGFALQAELSGNGAPSVPGTPTWLGFDVAVDGDTLVAGAPRTGLRGYAWVFERAGGVWTQSAVLASAIFGTGWAGYSVAVDGDRIAVGAPLNPSPYQGDDTGAVTLWERQPGGWIERALLAPQDAAAAHQVGGCVALQAELVAAGDLFSDLGAYHGGALHLFTAPAATGSSFCFGDGEGTTCPCGWDNSTPGAAGCRNGAGGAAVLMGFGSGGVAADDLSLVACSLLPGQPALLFHGTTELAGGDGLPFGNGLRCVGGVTERVSVQVPGADGGASWGGLASGQGFSAGQTARFQVWYRDPFAYCGQGFNTSNGLRVSFAP